MSYNYDLNPWDDNYDPNAAPQNTQAAAAGASSTNYGGYTDGYSNPAAQYSDAGFGESAQPQYQYQYQDEAQQQQPAEQQQYAPDQGQQQPPEKPPQSSAIGRFLRQRVPLCGPIMDTLSSINLPFVDALVQHINRDLLVSKMFYFFFYSAFGSLFPLMGVYFKQQGMNPAQVGILTGVRPFIEIFSAPFWNSLAERFQKSKALLLFSLLCWIVFTYSLAHIRPPASACVAFNDTDYVLYTPYSANDLSNYEVEPSSEQQQQQQQPADSGQLNKGEANEMFMNRMPSSVAAAGESRDEREGKDRILASEENQNNQRKRRQQQTQRRRKKRNTGQPAADSVYSYETRPGGGGGGGDQKSGRSRYAYSLDPLAGEQERLYGGDGVSHLELDADLESDFEDKLIQEDGGGPRGHHDGRWSFFGSDRQQPAGDESGAADYNELERLYSRAGDRSKRSPKVKDVDDVLGESDESEPDEQESASSSNEDEKSREPDDREESSEGDESEGEGASSSGRQRDGNNNNSNNNSRQPSQGAKASGAAATTTSTSLATTATSNALKPGQQYHGSAGLQERVDSANGGGGGPVNKTKRIYKQRHKTPPTHIVGMSPITVEYAVNYNKEKHSQFVTPMFSTIVYKLDDIKEVFFLLLLLISLGEFFSAPALTLADSATLSYLGDNTDLYGRQRMFGSLSWAVTLLLVGMALDNATSIADHPCGPHQRERSYTVCFVIFSLLMACAFLTATQFKFNYLKGERGSSAALGGGQAMVASTTVSNTVVTTTIDGSAAAGNIDQLYASTQPRSIFNTAPPVNAPPPNVQQDGKEKFEFLDKWRSAVFAQRTWELPEWVNVFRQFSNPLHLTYLFITWFLGLGVGLVFTFLFWHLQDIGGTPTLFGICSVINHISEILAYFFSFSFIKRFGHTRVLSVGLGCNVIRFLYVAFLTDPYYALPFELVQGITHAACFAACCSYMSHVSKPELRTSTQGVMQGLHHGIGRACGALLGGYMINAIGSRASFCIYGFLSGCVLTGFLYIRKKASEVADEEVKVDDSEALGGYGAPQGVPSAIPGKIGQTAPAAQDIDYQW